MHALALDLRGREEHSFNKLIEAEALAKSGRFIRPFIDCGQEMMILMNRFAERYPDREFTFTVLDGFATQLNTSNNKSYETSTMSKLSVSNTLHYKQLSKRELEVFKLLAKGWSNSEIASNLNISPETVKRHL